MELIKELGRRIQKARKEKGLTQEQIDYIMAEAGSTFKAAKEG